MAGFVLSFYLMSFAILDLLHVLTLERVFISSYGNGLIQLY